MKIKVKFAYDFIMVDLIDFKSYAGRGVDIKWAAFSESSDPNDDTIRWSKPNEDEEIDNETKRELLYYTALEIKRLGYTGYRGEYISKETKANIDRIIDDEWAPYHTEDNQNIQKKESKDTAALYGICFGVCFGMVIGLISGNITAGLFVGILVGFFVDMIWQKKK
jgi:tetrahydromethanopterin S-methyltransferase subunit G